MTGIGRGSGGPPWSVDLLADLQAGVLDPAQAAELWPRVNADPEAREILAALEATQADLREFALAPAPPMPAHFAARLDAAIAAEAQARFPAAPAPQPALAAAAYAGAPAGQPSAPVVNLAEARKRRNRKMGIGVGIFAAAAAAAAIAFVAIPGNDTGGVAVAPPNASSSAQGPLAFKSAEMGEAQLNAARGKQDAGPFADQAKRAACFEANGIRPTADPIGVSQVTVDGKPGTLFVLSSGIEGFRLIVVGPDCGPGNPAKLAEKTGVK